MTDNHHFSGWSRRQILKSGLALGGSFAVIGNPGNVLAQSGRAKTLAIAAPATPLSLDVENSLSLGTIDTVAAFYDYLIEFDMQPDPQLPAVMRENIAPDPSTPGGYHLRGKLAEKWEFSADGRVARFHLRQGVKSHYGNLLTAKDVKYTFDRKFEVKGAGAFMTGVMGLSNKDQVKIEGDYTISFNLDINDAPWVFISYPGHHICHSKDLGGLTYYTSNRLAFQDYVRQS